MKNLLNQDFQVIQTGIEPKARLVTKQSENYKKMQKLFER
jgi:hypothetical protein